jgi:hypothetical protein
LIAFVAWFTRIALWTLRTFWALGARCTCLTSFSLRPWITLRAWFTLRPLRADRLSRRDLLNLTAIARSDLYLASAVRADDLDFAFGIVNHG